MVRNLSITGGVHTGIKITLEEGKAYILIGKNGAGKSQLLSSIKGLASDSILLLGNYENIQEIESINKSKIDSDQKQNRNPLRVASLVASDPQLLCIFQYYFKILFETDLTIANNSFVVNGIRMNDEASGYRAIFNLLYYLISEHKLILLDEPERFFHPSMKSVFISLVSSIAKKYNKVIVLTSHSKETIRIDLDNIVLLLLKRPNSITNLNIWINTLINPTYIYPREKRQFTDWLSYHTEVFFSSANCLVEGVSDQIVLEAIKNKLALKYNLENISISHVASSYHEAGGKSKLHKFQAFLLGLNTTFVIADKDVINTDLNRWYTPLASDTDPTKIVQAKVHHLHILSKGEIEDYYFFDPASEFCTSAAIAKANKIAASYEQARIISTKSINEVEVQYAEFLEIFKAYVTIADTTPILKKLAKNYLIDKYGRGQAVSSHIEDAVAGGYIDIDFNFAGHGKNMHFPQASLDSIKQLDKEIEDNLK